MKLRIKGNSLRLRVTRSEVERFLASGRVEETIYFSPDEQSRLTYALEHSATARGPYLASRAQEVAMIVPEALALTWGKGEEVGIYENVDLGARGTLELVVEKDFACLDRSDAENSDTFPNPQAGAVC